MKEHSKKTGCPSGTGAGFTAGRFFAFNRNEHFCLGINKNVESIGARVRGTLDGDRSESPETLVAVGIAGPSQQGTRCGAGEVRVLAQKINIFVSTFATHGAKNEQKRGAEHVGN